MTNELTTDEPIISELDWLDRMDIDAARGIRDESTLPRTTFVDSATKDATYVAVILAGDGVVIVTDRDGREDFAWAGPLDAQEIIDDLVDDGLLVHDE